MTARPITYLRTVRAAGATGTRRQHAECSCGWVGESYVLSPLSSAPSPFAERDALNHQVEAHRPAERRDAQAHQNEAHREGKAS